MKQALKRHSLRVFAAITLAASSWGLAQAQGPAEFPQRPIKLLVGYSAGGATDSISRLVAQEMGAALGQSVVVENKPGANGNIATELIRRAAPDGYTLLINSLSHNVNPLLDPERVKYDPIRDFTPISRLVTGSQLMVVGPNSSFRHFSDLLQKARSAPEALSYGSAGIGSAAHLATALLEQYTKTRMNHVPFKGSSPALTEVMADRVDFMFLPLPGVAEMAKAGQIRVLATTSAKRLPDFPQVPTMAELGYADFGDYDQPLGILAPAGLPPAIAQKLDEAVTKALASPVVSARLTASGLVIGHQGPSDYSAWLAQDRARWAELIRNSNIRAQVQ